MPGSSSNSSFIPKRGTSKHKRKVRGGNIYILTIVSYVLFLGTIISAGAVTAYGFVVKGQLQEEIEQLNSAVTKFNQADLLRVQAFEERLAQTEHRLDNGASVVAILNAIEAATIDTVRFQSLDLNREFDEHFIIEANLETDSFDSAIFQRTIQEGVEEVEGVEFVDTSIQTAVSDAGTVDQSISVTALLAVPVSAVSPQVGVEVPAEMSQPAPAPVPETVPVETESEETDDFSGTATTTESDEPNEPTEEEVTQSDV